MRVFSVLILVFATQMASADDQIVIRSASGTSSLRVSVSPTQPWTRSDYVQAGVEVPPSSVVNFQDDSVVRTAFLGSGGSSGEREYGPAVYNSIYIDVGGYGQAGYWGGGFQPYGGYHLGGHPGSSGHGHGSGASHR
jgi:hypothetical protein